MSIRWIVPNDMDKIRKDTFQVVAKVTINVPPNGCKQINTGIGFELAAGMVFAISNNSLGCFDSHSIAVESTDNLIFVVRNNTANTITIQPGDKICIVKYLR